MGTVPIDALSGAFCFRLLFSSPGILTIDTCSGRLKFPLKNVYPVLCGPVFLTPADFLELTRATHASARRCLSMDRSPQSSPPHFVGEIPTIAENCMKLACLGYGCVE